MHWQLVWTYHASCVCNMITTERKQHVVSWPTLPSANETLNNNNGTCTYHNCKSHCFSESTTARFLTISYPFQLYVTLSNFCDCYMCYEIFHHLIFLFMWLSPHSKNFVIQSASELLARKWHTDRAKVLATTCRHARVRWVNVPPWILRLQSLDKGGCASLADKKISTDRVVRQDSLSLCDKRFSNYYT